MKILFRTLTFFVSFLLISCFLFLLFKPLYQARNVIFPFAITSFDIAQSYPKMWSFLKKSYFIFFFLSYFILFHYLYHTYQKYRHFKLTIHKVQDNTTLSFHPSELNLLIGKGANR